MTEADRLACADPERMLDFLGGEVSDRKLRLFACGCCRLVWDSLSGLKARKAVDIAERYADGGATAEELASAHAATSAWKCPADASAWDASPPVMTLREAVAASHHAAWAGGRAVTRAANLLSHAHLLRCIAGTPFRTPPRPPDSVLKWNDGTVQKIAEGIYEERAFDRLSILADALLDAGCEDEDLIGHCRQPGQHVRGCWAVDRVLNRG